MNLYNINNVANLVDALNHIYTGFAKSASLHKDTLRWINSGVKKNKGIPNQISANTANSLSDWLGVAQAVKKDYIHYLDKMKKIKNKDIEILIISEAPMLTLDKSMKFISNYIFSNCTVGSYRNVPYKAICNYKRQDENPKYKISAGPIIDLFQT